MKYTCEFCKSEFPSNFPINEFIYKCSACGRGICGECCYTDYHYKENKEFKYCLHCAREKGFV